MFLRNRLCILNDSSLVLISKESGRGSDHLSLTLLKLRFELTDLFCF